MSANQRAAADAPSSAPVPPKPLTLSIIRSATRAVDEDTLLATRVLRLDWLGLTSLGDSLDLFDGLRELYLQHNHLTDISGLELLQNLELLTLGGNSLRELDGLAGLHALRALDIRDNLIAAVPHDSLPTGLAILDLRGNPCAALPGHRARVLAMLPDCVCLDGEDLEIEGDDEEEREEGDAEVAGNGGAGSSPKESDESIAVGGPISPGSDVAASSSPTGGSGGGKVSGTKSAAAVEASLDAFRARREAVTRLFQSRLAEERSRADELATAALAASEVQLAAATERLAAAREAVALHSRERAEALHATAGGLERAAKALSEPAGGASESKG